MRINALITLVVFLPVAAVAIVATAAGTRISRYREASREAAGRVSDALGEMFGAVLAIKVADAEDRVVDRFRTLHFPLNQRPSSSLVVRGSRSMRHLVREPQE